MWVVYSVYDSRIVEICHTLETAKRKYKCRRNPISPFDGWFGLDKTDDIEKWKMWKILSKQHDQNEFD
jgi:hypothetical protein